MMAEEIIGAGTLIPPGIPTLANPHPAAVQPVPVTAQPNPSAPVHVNVNYPPQAAPVVAPATPVAPASPATATITLEQLQAFTMAQTRVAQMEADQKVRDDAAKAQLVAAMAAKGDIENAFRLAREQSAAELKAEKDRLTETDNRARRYALDGELARTLASHPLVPSGAEQLTQLWRSQFVVEPQGDSFAVRTPTYQPVGEFIAAQLGRPEYAHFVRAQNPQGGIAGTGGQGTSPTPSATPVAQVQPRNLGEAIALNMANAAKNQSTQGHLTGGSTISDEGVVTREKAMGFGLRPFARQA